ncbi:PepSY domain-containing protein [Alteromonas pelagimontana]|uniref:PepSY domain-containing protein n=1 Tax=Alteromonas pelagimontana TaxID=1858656 RepID=A0A6M4MII3_9ALTE|nr:PepSY-associated TM helix domain-containing protein [Alteromonas pelagimontana]QJR82857.1 PepSY domain-containing protein [Alteromonas pelagimontana]
MSKVNNKLWFQLHGWCSLPVWVLICFICLSGTVAVVSHEITWLTNTDSRAQSENGEPAISPAKAVAIVEQAYPTADVTGVAVRESYLTYTVMFTDTGKPFALAYVNQYNGDIQEVNDGNTFINFMRSLHGWLLFPWQHSYSIGYYLVGLMGFFMLGALITGLMVYKKFWRAFTQPTLRTQQGTKTLLTDSHRLAGAWSIWFLLIMSLTGAWYFIQGALWHGGVEVEPYPSAFSADLLPQGEQNNQAASLDDALAITQQQFPDFIPSYIALPEHNRDTYKISGHGDFLFFDDLSYRVAVNPWNGVVQSKFSPATMTPLQTISHLVDPLHYGTIGGIWTKVIWFIFGVLLTAMSITGFIMWRMRLVQATKKRRETLAATSYSEAK